MLVLYNTHIDSPLIKEMEERADHILNSDYSKVDIAAMVSELEISNDQKKKLQATLEKFPELFGGGLGKLKNTKPAWIKLKKGSKPASLPYYNLPKAYLEKAKKEIKQMVKIGVLEKILWYDNSPWSAPTFAVPKKMGDLLLVTNFQKMNACIE